MTFQLLLLDSNFAVLEQYISRTIDVTTFSTRNDSLDFGLVTYGTPDIKYFACSNKQTMMIFSYEISN